MQPRTLTDEPAHTHCQGIFKPEPTVPRPVQTPVTIEAIEKLLTMQLTPMKTMVSNINDKVKEMEQNTGRANDRIHKLEQFVNNFSPRSD